MKYKVVKEYCGIKKGTIVERADTHNSAPMIKKGYWVEHKPVKGKVEKGLDYIKNKIEPGVSKRKTK